MAASENDSQKKKRTADDNLKRQKHITRQNRMELSKADMLQLLGHLEKELQARDRIIATLKAEKAKQFLYQAKYGRFSLSDPMYVMQHESDADREAALRAMYDDPMTQLDKLIGKQHEAEKLMKEQLEVIDKRYLKVCTELEEEKQKHNRDLEQGDSVVLMLEKDRERLQSEVEQEKSQNQSLEAVIQSTSDELAKLAKHRDVVVKLLKKRSQIVNDVSNTQCKITSSEETLQKAEAEARRIEECLSDECSKCSHIEAATDKQLGVASKEREQLLARLSLVERQNRELLVELEKLRSAVGSKYRQNTIVAPSAPIGHITPVAHHIPVASGAHSTPVMHHLPVAPNTPVVLHVPVAHGMMLVSDGVAAAGDGVMASRPKHVHSLPAEASVAGAMVPGDARLTPAKGVAHAGMLSTKVGDVSRTGSLSEGNSTKFVAGHQITLSKPADARMASTADPSISASTPGVVSVTTGSGAKISVSVPGPAANQMRKPSLVGASAIVAGRGAPPPVPPNKPQVSSLTQSRLPAPPAGACRANLIAQPSKPQPQMKYEITRSQDHRPTVLDKPMLTAAAAAGASAAAAGSMASSRPTPAPSSQTGSHLAMVVGDTSNVHKHPSQVCVNIK